MEAELHELLVEYEVLTAALPTAVRAMDRWKMGRRREAVLNRIAEIYGEIASTQPKTLAGAAVQLRRALAALDAHNCKAPCPDRERMEARLVASALVVVEANA